MIIATFFVCGLRVPGPTTCEIVNHAKLAEPVKLEIQAGEGGATKVTANASGWKVTLTKGAYIIQVTAPLEGSEPGKSGTGGLDLTCKGVEAFVEVRAEKVMAWGDVAVASTSVDPKDPWPPPLAQGKATDTTWFEKIFPTLNVVMPRSGPLRDAPAPGPRRAPPPKPGRAAPPRKPPARPRRRGRTS